MTYRSTCRVRPGHVRYLAARLGWWRRVNRTRWRKLSARDQARLVLVWLRKGERLVDLAAGFGVSTATAWRYCHEAVRVLARQAPSLHGALHKACWAQRTGDPIVILDGTLIPINRPIRIAERAYYSGKHRRHGINLQVLADRHGNLLWVSPALPGATHDLTAARTHHIPTALAQAGLTVLADKLYQGADQPVRVPRKKPRNQPRPEPSTTYNRLHAALRAPGERANATLKTWHILNKYRGHTPEHAGHITQAITTLITHQR